MEIQLSNRVKETNKTIRDLVNEINDYSKIAMLIRVLQAVELNDELKESSTPEDYDKAVSKLHSLCQKHEIVLPEFIEWSDIHIV